LVAVALGFFRGIFGFCASTVVIEPELARYWRSPGESLAAASFLVSGCARASRGPVPLARPRPIKKASVLLTAASDFLKI
jgi:hypothetical protein